MSNSSLVQYTRLSPNCNKPRNKPITKITIHHTAGVLSVEQLGSIFAPVSRQASSNYGIGSDGRIGMYVEEKNRAWTSRSAANDNQAITIEVSNSEVGGDWLVSDLVLNRLIELCVDICRRNGIDRLNFTGDANGNLTAHKFFANTACPGPYLYSKFQYIADTVNNILHPVPVPEPAPQPAPVPTGFSKGERVAPTRLVSYTGQRLTQYDKEYIVYEDSRNDRVVLSAPRNGVLVVWAAMNIKDVRRI